MWDLPGTGLEPVSPAGRFLTTEPPGKPQESLARIVNLWQSLHFILSLLIPGAVLFILQPLKFYTFAGIAVICVEDVILDTVCCPHSWGQLP